MTTNGHTVTDKILSNPKIKLRFFKCDAKGKTVHCGTCAKSCDKFESCDIIRNVVGDCEKPVYVLKSLGRKNMPKYLLVKQRLHSLEDTESLEKKKISDKAKIFMVKAQYRVANKLVAADKKVEPQKNMKVFEPTSGAFEELKKLDLKTGDIIYEIGKEFKVVRKLIRVREPKKKTRRRSDAVQRQGRKNNAQ